MSNLVYLAGPISGCSFTDCTDWRKYVMDNVSEYIHTISPLRGKEHLAKENKIADSYEKDYLASARGINCRDYWDVQRCSIVFVNFLGATKVSIGTVMEIAWARAFNKPVICVMEEDNVHQHSMLGFACGYIVPTLEIGLEILEALLSTDKQLDANNGVLNEVRHHPNKPGITN